MTKNKITTGKRMAKAMTGPASLMGLVGLVLILAAPPLAANDFPTRARAEYVFACMSSNGESELMIGRCACALDTIAELMPYDQYVDAETAIRMRLVPGERTAMFREVEWVRRSVEQLKAAQAEAEIRCF